MTRIEFWPAAMGLLVAIVVLFNQMNGRLDALQAETNQRFDQAQAENNQRFDQMFDRLDRMQEAIRSFDRRVSHLEGRFDELSTGGAQV